jgi:hypothetical protein
MEKEGLGLYLYCLYYGGIDIPFPVGVDGDHKVFTLSYGDINAAVSFVPLHEFGSSELEQKTGDLEWVAPRVCIHERIIEAIMAVYPVMPMRFCTIFAARDRIEGLVKIHQQIDNLRSLGLMGMRERIILLGGQFNISGIKGKGTTITAQVPLDKPCGRTTARVIEER